jgi:hypothetical protein
MPVYGQKIRVTRTSSSVGPVLVVHSPGVSRIGQVYMRESDRGIAEFYAWVTHGVSPSIAPSVERVPFKGGLSTIEELEKLIAERNF